MNVEVIKAFAIITVRTSRSSGVFWNGDVCTLGEANGGGWEIESLAHHQELKDITAGSTSKAMEALALRVDIEGGGLLFVEWAEGAIVGASLFQWDIQPLDDLHDTVGGPDLGNEVLSKKNTHGEGKSEESLHTRQGCGLFLRELGIHLHDLLDGGKIIEESRAKIGTGNREAGGGKDAE